MELCERLWEVNQGYIMNLNKSTTTKITYVYELLRFNDYLTEKNVNEKWIQYRPAHPDCAGRMVHGENENDEQSYHIFEKGNRAVRLAYACGRFSIFRTARQGISGLY